MTEDGKTGQDTPDDGNASGDNPEQAAPAPDAATPVGAETAWDARVEHDADED